MTDEEVKAIAVKRAMRGLERQADRWHKVLNNEDSLFFDLDAALYLLRELLPPKGEKR